MIPSIYPKQIPKHIPSKFHQGLVAGEVLEDSTVASSHLI